MWPFEHEDARLVFCPLATADMREMEQIFFHFIVDYGERLSEREGHPILVQQRIRVAEDVPSHMEGTVERWAITLMDGQITNEIVPILSIPPFWFEYALAQNLRPLIQVNGRRLSAMEMD